MIVLIIIIITCVISIAGFYRPELMVNFNFNAYRIYHHKEYYRLITHAFLHVDWLHLGVNMFVFWSFGRAVQVYLDYYVSVHTTAYFLTLYFGSIISSVLFDLAKHKHNMYYNAVGASGAVSAILYCSIFFAPLTKVLFFGIIPIPGIVFGLLFLAYSWYLGKKGTDNIGHDAHFWGAVFGFVFPLAINIKLFWIFYHQMFGY